MKGLRVTLTIVGLGPGRIEDITRRAWQALEQAHTVYLATAHHASVPHLPLRGPAIAFDERYTTGDLAAAFDGITATLVQAAAAGEVVLAVPGSPVVGEPLLPRLRAACAAAGVPLVLIHGLSFLEPLLEAAGLDALDGLQIVEGTRLAALHHPPLNPDYPAVVAGVYEAALARQVQRVLLNQYPPEHEIVLAHGAGTTRARLERRPLRDLAQSPDIGQFTALVIPPAAPYSSFEAFQEIIAHLRAPAGCPWDREQTHQSLRKYLLEETYEALEALDQGDAPALAGELGDLLLQIVLHTQIATEKGDFQMRDVLRHVSTKMIRRHPHVWGEVDVAGDARQVLANWDKIKQAENAAAPNKRASLLDGLPAGLPALLVAYQYTDRAARVGFDWPTVAGVEDKVREELAEIEQEDDPARKAGEIGDLIFVLVNWLRWLNVADPESLLREINAKFYRRFRYIEDHAPQPLNTLPLAALDALWDEAKRQGL
ncbi:MAG: nucleoside triphosphate pyrophosphohydrolase [Anaerolineae bacterium]|nr:nucleoside triphosphate pyrophosphohydrolase [Anaerolineae bacterium]